MENLLSNKPKTTGQTLENVGYSKSKSENPHDIINTPGVQTALAELGLKEALISQGIDSHKIAEKINVLLNGVDKEGSYDYTAIDKGLKHATAIYGITEEPKQTTNVYNFVNNPVFLEKIKNFDNNYKNQVLHVQKTQTIQEDMEHSE